MNSINRQRRQAFQSKLEEFFDNHYFDIQGMSTKTGTLDEAYLGRILTKLAIGSATVWWSLLEIKDFLHLYRKVRKGNEF